MARLLHALGVVADPAAALSLKERPLQRLLTQLGQAVGVAPKTFAGEILAAVVAERQARWLQKLKEIDWKLFDRGVEAYTWLSLEELVRAADAIALLSGAAHGQESLRFAREVDNTRVGIARDLSASQPFVSLVEDLKKPFAAAVFLWLGFLASAASSFRRLPTGLRRDSAKREFSTTSITKQSSPVLTSTFTCQIFTAPNPS